MCFENQDFRKWLRDVETGKRILAVIVDEAHCGSQWGGDFRPHYGLLYRLRALLPVGTPILATSATLSPSALTEVCSGLDLDLERSFFLNLGNDRPNITPSIVQMNGGKDYTAIDPHLPDPAEVHSVDDLPKAIVFTNAVKKTQVICRHLRRRYSHLRGAIDFLHAHRTAKSKRRIMKEFRKGKIKILVATEAAGMVRIFFSLPSPIYLITLFKRALTSRTSNSSFSLVFRHLCRYGLSAQDAPADPPSYMRGQFFLLRNQCSSAARSANAALERPKLKLPENPSPRTRTRVPSRVRMSRQQPTQQSNLPCLLETASQQCSRPRRLSQRMD